eukprot:jgi/Galph1/2622/GphlegSOOS_G1278.1
MVTLNLKDARLLIVGSSGELGNATLQATSESLFWKDKNIFATYYRQKPSDNKQMSTLWEWRFLDLGDHESVRRLLLELAPTSVICCSVPAHQGASSVASEDLRKGIVHDVVALAQASKMIGARFIAISTDQVFDGTLKQGRYREEDPVSPITPYGQFKAEMERQLLNLGGDILICRTSLILTLFPPGKAVQFVLNAFEEENAIELFTDELRNMSFSDDLGPALCELAVPGHPTKGLLHLCCDEPVSRYDLALHLAPLFKKNERNIKTAKSASSGLNRPLNLSLDNGQAKSVLKTRIQGVPERLSQ